MHPKTCGICSADIVEVCLRCARKESDNLREQLKEKELQNKRLQGVVNAASELIGGNVTRPEVYLEGDKRKYKLAVALQALSGKRCPSTYTHSSLGKLECEKDEAHLHRLGDVEHTRDGVKWMSV